MSNTRYYDDQLRIQKRLQISTNAGRYALMTPGQGLDLPYVADPHYRLEKWGGNSMTNAIGVEGDLWGLTRRLTHDDINRNDYKKNAVYAMAKSVSVNSNVMVDESRTSLPAFLFRETEMYRWETPFLNPQANLEIPFNNNLQSRIIEKDYWTQNNM